MARNQYDNNPDTPEQFRCNVSIEQGVKAAGRLTTTPGGKMGSGGSGLDVRKKILSDNPDPDSCPVESGSKAITRFRQGTSGENAGPHRASPEHSRRAGVPAPRILIFLPADLVHRGSLMPDQLSSGRKELSR